MIFPYTGAASLLIGLLQVLWALIPLVDAHLGQHSLFSRALSESDTGDEWFATMLLTGALLAVASVMRRRSLRHVALFLSSSVLLASFALFIHMHVVTPVTLTLPVLGLYCILLLIIDAANKNPKARRVDA